MTTRVGSAPEVVLDGATGFVTTVEVADLARAANRLLDDAELRSRMGAAAAAHAAENFSAERLASDIRDLYERIAVERALL